MIANISAATPAPTRAIAYIRIARAYSDSELSLQKQLADVRSRAAEYGVDITHEFVDVGWSGTTTERPGLAAMYAHLSQSDVDICVVESLWKVARTSKAFTEIHQRLEAHGVTLLPLDAPARTEIAR
jgi:DNA invertase Pin-like site-specific DNA recombinase